MPTDLSSSSHPRLHSLRFWLTDKRAFFDLWTAVGLGGPGVILCLVGAEVVRLWFAGRIDAHAFAFMVNDPVFKDIGLASLPAPVAFGIGISGAGILFATAAWRLVRARSEVLRLRGH